MGGLKPPQPTPRAVPDKINSKVEEMVAKAKYIKRCHILAEMTSQLNQNDSKPGKTLRLQEILLCLLILEV